jgi:hypothetical protein
MPITSLDDLAVGKAWPPACDKARLKCYADGRALLDGRHADVFTDVLRIMQRDRRRSLTFIALSHPRRIVKAFGDMVLGESPTFRAKGVEPEQVADTVDAAEGRVETEEESRAQEQVETYVAEFDLVHEAYQVLVDMQSLGDGVLKVTLEDKGVAGLYPDINAADPCIWYPVVNPEDRQDITAHILAWTWITGTGSGRTTNLRAEVHEPGTLTTYSGTIRNGKIETLEMDGDPRSTGVDECLVVPVFNFRSSADCTGVSDFTDLSPILQEMEVRLYLIASILDKHSDPKLWGPRSLVSTDANTGESVVAQTDYVVIEQGESVGYVTWEGQLAAAYKELDFLADQALFVMEASPALFGNIDGQVTSGAALKRLLIAPLMKASRLRSRLDIALKKALKLASLLHNTVDASAPVFGEVDILWNDGLPVDDFEQMSVHTGYVTAGIESKRDAVSAIFGVDGTELDERMARLDEEKPAPPAFTPPRIVLTPPGSQEPAPQEA